MPITKQAAKKLRHDRVRTIQSAAVRTKLRKLIRAVRVSPTPKKLSGAFSAIDRAAKHRIIHKNTSVRLKSRLSKLLKK